MNPLKELRERKRFTRQQMGDLLGLKAPSIDKCESDMGEEAALTCAALAEQEGHYGLVPEFYENCRKFAGEDRPKAGRVEPGGTGISASRHRYRAPPQNGHECMIPNFIMETAKYREKIEQEK